METVVVVFITGIIVVTVVVVVTIVVVTVVFTVVVVVLQYMAQIKEKQAEQERGDWERLSVSQRQETENEFHHLSMLARFHNIMGSETIQCLELLTKEIKTIFCHLMIVDRMAAMLNYFLLHLVSAALCWIIYLPLPVLSSLG